MPALLAALRRLTPAIPLLGVLACAPLAPVAHPPAAPAASSRPESLTWARDATFYEVFVRSFADSNGDGVGDLAGLTAHLDYLNDGDPATTDDLGVNALWLMPIFPSPSYHGYDVTDYRGVQPAYGNLKDLDALLQAAHQRGMRVILDLVVNHTSDQHPWFQDALTGPLATHRSWYVWRPDDPGWTQPWGGRNPTWHRGGGAYYYGIFWRGMPDLNWRQPVVRRTMADIAAYWLRRGVDGFRLDAVRHLVADGPGELQNDRPETHLYVREFVHRVEEARSDALLVGECWSDTQTIATYYGQGDELPMTFDFPLAEAIAAAIEQGEALPLAKTLHEVAATYPAGVLDGTFLGNHDQIRIATRLGDDPARLRLAAALLLTLPGTPFLYYGEELGLQNGPGGLDEEKRTPMPWNGTPAGGFSSARPWHALAPGSATDNVATETGDATSLLSRYRQLIRLRQRWAALRYGELRLLETPANVLVFTRSLPGQRLLVVHSLGDQPLEVELPPDLRKATFEPVFNDPGCTAAASETGLHLAPHGSAIWLVTAREDSGRPTLSSSR